MWDALRGYHVACLLFVCFLLGAWRCLNRNIGLKARHPFFPSLVVCCWLTAEKEE